MSISDLSHMSAADIARVVRAKALSPVETVENTLREIERRNPAINAVVFTDPDGAIDRAKQLEKKILAGEDIGLLAGVPTVMIDLFGEKPGWPATMGGLSALKDSRSSHLSTFPRSMEREGGIVVGATNSPTFGFRGVTDNRLFGATKNPFNTEYNPGGSSGGSSAAVADGLVSLAGGSDAGGSIRIPAAWSGTVGFQPSAGRVPMAIRPNAFGDSTFIYEGPITRTVEDAALGMQAMASFDPRDPVSFPGHTDFLSAARRGVKGMRIGFTPDFGIFPVDPRIQSTVQDAANVFTELGAEVEHVDFNMEYSHHDLSEMWCNLLAILAYDILESFAQNGNDLRELTPQDLSPALLKYVDNVPNRTMSEWLDDQKMRTHILDSFIDVFSTYDLVVSPTLAAMPVKNALSGETFGPTEINGEPINPSIGWCMTYLTNFTGNPSASVPAGMVDGLPVGMMVIGRKAADEDVMAASGAFEQARPWASHYEAVWNRENSSSSL